jgi:glycosyltransferase involved in cell wall biosynthesis
MALYTAGGRRRILPPLVFGLGVFLHLLRNGRRYEVVHTCAFPYFSLLAAALVRPLGRFELVVDWFEVWSRSYWLDYLGGPGGRVGALVQRICALVPQRAFCFSELHGKRLREEGLRGPVTVLRGLYAEASESVEPRQADPLVLFAGRLIPEKQVTLGVAAIALATPRIEGLRGEFLGDGPERGALEASIAEHGLKETVSAPGFTDAETLDAEMRRALCMLLPSRREGYGMVVVEADRRGCQRNDRRRSQPRGRRRGDRPRPPRRDRVAQEHRGVVRGERRAPLARALAAGRARELRGLEGAGVALERQTRGALPGELAHAL